MKVQILFVLVGLAGLVASVGTIASARESDRRDASYYANGQVESECSYEDGRREGPYHRFAPDGTPVVAGEYKADRMDGRWSYWRKDGSLDAARSGLYRAGERISD